VLEVETTAHQVRIHEDCQLIAVHDLLQGRKQRSVLPGPRHHVAARPSPGRSAMSGLTTDRIRRHLIGLKMQCALEALQTTLSRIEQGEVSALEAIEALLCRSVSMTLLHVAELI